MQKLAEICIRRPVFATMLIMALVVVGGFCYTRLGVDLFPKVDFPTVTVTTVLPSQLTSTRSSFVTVAPKLMLRLAPRIPPSR